MVPHLCLGLLAVPGPQIDQSKVEAALRLGLSHLHGLSPKAAEQVLLPQVQRIYPSAEWVGAQRTLGGQGLVLELNYPSYPSGGLLDQASDAIVWRRNGRTRVQVLDPGDERFLSYEAFLGSCRLVRCGTSYGGGNYGWTSVVTYRLNGSRWRLASDDEANAEPEMAAHFLRLGGKVVPHEIVVNSRVYPDNLDEPHAGPKLWFRSIWRVRDDKCLKGRDHLIPSPLAVLDHIAGLAQAGDSMAFNRRVPRSYRKLLWQLLQNGPCFFCGHSNQSDTCNDLLLWNDHVHEPGSSDLVIHFKKRQGRWRLVRISHEPRANGG